jgi:phenylacetate-CoA ligase
VQASTAEAADMSAREVPLTAGERAALRTFRRAALTSRGYRAHLERLGVDHLTVTRLAQVPFTDKASVFGDHIEFWLDGGRVSDAAELLTSSGASGLFSVGVTSRAERRAQERTFDLLLRSLGGGEDSTTLLLNCLPMGISIPTRLATVATPSVHLEMALELLARAGSSFDRVIIAAEPLFLKELAETALRERGPAFADRVVACFVGGEWVAESWRRYVSELFGFADESERLGLMVSMGAAEVGLHALHETPELRQVRGAIDSPMSRRALFGRDPGYSPTLLAWDPNRYYVEERRHGDGTTSLVLTALTRRLLPLVRYDLDDEAQVLAPATLNAELGRQGTGVRLDRPVVALWGRRGATVSGEGWSLRPELVKEGLFSTAAHAGALTGRFRIAADGGRPVLHVQLREGARPGPGIEAALRHMTTVSAGAPAAVVIHPYRDYPYHEAGDHQHKAAYVARRRP